MEFSYKKVKPYAALVIKKGLVKDKYDYEPRIKKELVLTLPNKHLESGFFHKNCVNSYIELSAAENYAVEQAMLEVLIETQGMSDKATYKIGITDNLLKRFKQLKPDEVLNVVRCSNYESLEKELHKNFKKIEARNLNILD